MNGRMVTISVATNIGFERDRNEDSFSINGNGRAFDRVNMEINGVMPIIELFLLGVYDGMGGRIGEISADIAVQFSMKLTEKLRGSEPEDYGRLVDGYVNAANAEICRRMNDSENDHGGTTFVTAFFSDGMVYPFSLGDSRMYLFSGGELTQITEDHTAAVKKLRADIYTAEQARTSSDRHILTLYIGADREGKGLHSEKYPPFPVPEGGRLMLCTDGLYNMVTEERMAEILSDGGAKPASLLTDEALNNGGRDNITCIIADFD